MRKYENECVSCPQEMGCLGDSCPNRNVEHVYCDGCGDEIGDDGYEYDDRDLCEPCLLGALLEDGVISRVEDE